MSIRTKLLDALHKAVASFNQNNDPDAAVIKTAREANFNIEQAKRLTEMFNTARTLYHYKTANDRASSFSLADADVVTANLFTEPARPPETAEKLATDIIHYDAMSFYDNLDRHDRVSTQDYCITKTAEDLGIPQTPVSEELPSIESMAMRATRELNGLYQTAKFAEDTSVDCEVTAGDILEKVATVLSRGYTDEAIGRNARLFAAYGGRGFDYCSATPAYRAGRVSEYDPVLSKLAERMAPSYLPDKRLIAKFAGNAVIDDTDFEQIGYKLAEARKLMTEAASLKAASQMLLKEANNVRDALHDALRLPGSRSTVSDDVSSLLTFKTAQDKDAKTEADAIHAAALKRRKAEIDLKATQDKQFRENLQKVTQPAKSTSDFVFDKGINLGNAVITGKVPTLPGLDSIVDNVFTGPDLREARKQERLITNVKRQIVLEELLATDPVLANEDPDAVLDAYVSLLEMVPEMTLHKDLLRSVLRQHVQSTAISPYDVDQLAKLDARMELQRKGAPPAPRMSANP